jgi:hypothetical protein
LYLLSWRIAPREVLAGLITCHDTPPFKSRHHPNSRIAPGAPSTKQPDILQQKIR